MATWTPNTGRLYLPPAKPVATVLSTDDYIVPTNLYFHANSDRLLTVGHPYFDVLNDATKAIEVPKVSGNQFRVLRLKLPDPNKFALIDKSVYNPEKERLVWRLRGVQIDRGGPLGIGTTGHPLFDRLADTENPNVYAPAEVDDSRQNMSFDPKQNQLFIVGCLPATGQHWDIAEPCKDPAPPPNSCPPIKLMHSIIQDGDMSDIGLGNVNFNNFSASRSDAPLDVINSVCKWPDFVQMTKDTYGDRVWFFGKREQVYTRHMLVKGGVDGDSLPHEPTRAYYITPNTGTLPDGNLGKISYFPTPSGSLVSSEATIFNRPYWLHQAQGKNNGIAWGNNIFITLLDNTHNTNFILSVYTGARPMEEGYTYKKADFKKFLRHTEELELEIVMQLCKVPLEANVLAHINAMDPTILENWQLAFVPAPPQNLEDTYRYIQSLATMCPADVPPANKPDPFEKYSFWDVDLTDKFTSELDQTPLGRKFLYTMGMLNGRKRPRVDYTTGNTTVKRVGKTAKRRKTRM
ncbi:L1 protein [Human papillomavirus 116]|uniref:Major capsid protein L1 n=2 Tax=Papillomaviridae TaxID=151340 RepID=C7B7D8_9PAPI|nr:L1 protein [Human papillomavirus 116]ACT76418.1 L1 protein [Human papillomavirus 116]